MNIMKTVQVALDDRSYDIVIGTALLEQSGEKIAALVKGRQILIVTDSNVGPLYADIVRQSLEAQHFQVAIYTIPAGESSKSWQNAEAILTVLLEKQYHRDCCVIALGGGVVGDLAGFVASIYQRGVDFIQIPTSLLAQVDSSVGGKVAVNHALGKNMIGSFYQPKFVLIDLDVLSTLEQRHWKNGLSEVVKYGVIYDADFFHFLKQNAVPLLNRDVALSAEMIASCCQMKAQVVALDEKESGVRAKLNYGHTIGHGLELAGHYQGNLHGEAVAVGMVLAARYAAKINLCDALVEQAILELLEIFQLPIHVEHALPIGEILDGILLDKKVQEGQLVLILPTAVGHVEIVKGVPLYDIEMLLKEEYDLQR